MLRRDLPLRRTVASTLLAAALASAFETSFAVFSGWQHAPGYFALCALLSLATAAGLALSIGASRRIGGAVLAVWAGLLGGVATGPAAGFTIGLAACVARPTLQRLAGSTASPALALAGALAWTLVVLPRLLARIPLGPLTDGAGQWAVGPVFFLASAAALAWLGGIARRLGAASTPVLVALAALAPSALPAWTGRSLPDRATPHFDRTQEGSARPHVLLLVLDTVRADHLSVYGYERDTLPQLAEFLRTTGRSAIFPAAFSNGNWTVPSHASLLTGLLPSEHGAHFGSGTRTDFELVAESTLAERLHDAGYATMAVFANPWLERVSGMARGFEVFFKPVHPDRLPLVGEDLRRLLVPGVYPEALDGVPAARFVNEQVRRYLPACTERGACFALVNYIEGHTYYVPDAPCRGRFAPWSLRERFGIPSVHMKAERLARLEARYDEEICSLDREVTGLLEWLAREGILDEAWIFVTSDHGESFGEHGVTEHGTSVYDPQVRVPLIVIAPAGEALAATDEPVSLVDVAATIAGLAGAPKLGGGRDLRSPARDSAARVEFFGDATKVRYHGALAAEAAAVVIAGRYKLIAYADRLELYDLRADPDERVDLAARSPELVESLRAQLPPLKALPASAPARPLSPEERELLRELGYLR